MMQDEIEPRVEAEAALSHVEMWRALHEPLRLKLGNDVQERWLGALTVLSESGPVVRLGVANRFVLAWVEKRYLAVMDEQLRERFPAVRKIELAIDPQQFQRLRREREALLKEKDAAPEASEAGGLQAVAPPPAETGNPCPDDKGREEQTLEDYVVGDCNRLAFNAVQEVAERPGRLYNPLFLFGPTGVGKTHLVKGLLKRLRSRRRRPDDPRAGEAGTGSFYRVAYLTGEQFFQSYVASIQDRTIRQFQERIRRVDVLIVDDVHLLVNKRKTQMEFLHTFTALGDTGRQVILTSDVPPRDLQELDGALLGRFSSGLVVGLRRPDYSTRLGIARSVAARLDLRLDPSVLELIAAQLRGNAREIAGAVKQLHHRSRLAGGKLPAANAMSILEEYFFEHARRIDLPRIADAVGAHFGLASEALRGGARQKSIAVARQIAMYLSRRFTRRSLAEIGNYFGKRNHSTVKCAEVKLSRLLEGDGSPLAKDVAAIVEALED